MEKENGGNESDDSVENRHDGNTLESYTIGMMGKKGREMATQCVSLACYLE